MSGTVTFANSSFMSGDARPSLQMTKSRKVEGETNMHLPREKDVTLACLFVVFPDRQMATKQQGPYKDRS